jgi:hypothetical protein
MLCFPIPIYVQDKYTLTFVLDQYFSCSKRTCTSVCLGFFTIMYVCGKFIHIWMCSLCSYVRKASLQNIGFCVNVHRKNV